MQSSFEIVSFIDALQSPDNNIRDQAEKQLDNIVSSAPWQLVDCLIQVINENALTPDKMQYAFIIMKRIFSDIAAYATSKDKRKFPRALNGVDLNKYGQQLINYLVLVSKQPQSSLRASVIRCVGSFAEIVLYQSQWPNLVQTLTSMVSSGDLEAQYVACEMTEEVSSLSEKPLMNIAGSLVDILSYMASKPIHTFKASVLAIMARTYSSLLISISTKSAIYHKLCSMISIFWNFLKAGLEEGDTESCSDVINSVILVLQCRTKLCNEELLSGFNIMTEIITSSQVPIDLRKSAMTLFSMYVKNFTRQLYYPGSNGSNQSSPHRKNKTPIIPTNVNANVANTERVVEVLVTWCSDIPDKETWVSDNPEAEDEDEDESSFKPDGTKYLYRVGQDMLDSLAMSVGYRIMFGILKSLTPRLLISPEWTARSTACIMYCLCVEGLGNVPESLETVKEANCTLTNEDIIQICSWVCSLADDPHPRVRWAVAQTLGQMCADLSPKLQQLCGKLVVETLFKLMDDVPTKSIDTQLIANCRYSNMEAYFARPCFRVVAHSAASLGNFYTESKITESLAGTQNYVVASIEASLDRISRLMSIDNLFIQKNCITTLGNIANTSSTFFSSKYKLFIGPCLTQLERYLSGQLTEPATKRPFAHQLIETISLIGHAVGPEMFKEDGIRFMNMLIHYKVIGEGCNQRDALLRSALFKAMSNVNNSMGKYLQQNHINAMMLTICDTLKSDLTVTKVFNDEDDEFDDEDDDDGDVYEVGGMKVRYYTAIFEEVEDASDLMELLLGDHFIETSGFYSTVLELSMRILENNGQSMGEFALTNILCVVRAIKHLVKCLKFPEKNETGLPITVTADDINNIQELIYSRIIPNIIKLLPDLDVEIKSSGVCIDILRNFIFSAPQYIIGPDMARNKTNLEEYYIKPILMTHESVTNYFREVVENDEGDYDEPYILDEKENYSSYVEIVGLAIASGFSFMKNYPAFNFVDIYNNYFKDILINFLTGQFVEERDFYCDTRVAGCIVGQNIAKLPQNIINSSPVLKHTLTAIIVATLSILSGSLTIKGSGASTILPSSEYPTLQAGYYVLKCIISASENISVTTEIFDYVAKQNGMDSAWAVLDFIVDTCMKFTKLCTSDGGSIEPEIQVPYDNASSCWFSCIMFSPQRYGKLFVECLSSMQKISEDPVEIADIIKTIHHMFITPTDIEKQLVSAYAPQLLAVLIVLICNNVIRYSLKRSVINMARVVLTQARSSDMNKFVEIVKSLNNPIIEVDLVEFLRT